MADERHHHVSHEESESRPVIVDDQAGVVEGVETKDRGMFDFLGGKKDEEKPGHVQEVVIASEFEEKVTVCEKPAEEEGEKKHHGLLDKLHRSDSSSSSSSDEECEDEEKKKKKEKKKEKRKEKKEEGKMHEEDTTVPVEKCEVEAIPSPPEEKKGFLEKIKEKLPGQHKKAAEEVPPPPPPVVECAAPPTELPPPPPQCQEGEAKEKKGILEKIKEKLPGYHHNKTEEEKEKEKC